MTTTTDVPTLGTRERDELRAMIGMRLEHDPSFEAYMLSVGRTPEDVQACRDAWARDQQGTQRSTQERPTGLVECKPWCQYSDGHPGALFRADQYCASVEVRVPLPGQSPHIDWARAAVVTDEEYRVYAIQAPDAAEPQIVACLDGNSAPKLTPSQVRELVEALQLVLGQVTS